MDSKNLLGNRSASLLTLVVTIGALLSGFTSSARAVDATVSSGSFERDYVAVTPARILDTRSAIGSPGPLLSGQTLSLQVSGSASLPVTGVGAVVLNVTATQPTATSFLTVFPADQPKPTASNLNFVATKTVPNLVIAKLSASGQISIYNEAGSVHVLADVMGWFPTGSSYQALAPLRILDTRTAVGAPLARLGPNADIDIQVSGKGGVPSTGVRAVVLNVTATSPTTAGWVAVFPSQTGLPSSSNLNFVAGQTIANVVITGLSADGRVRLHNSSGSVDLIADVQGWFSSSSTYHPVTPTRVLDTRSAIGVSTTTPVAAKGVVNVKLTGTNGLPEGGVGAVVLNVTVAGPTATSWVAAYATGSNLPNVSNLNFEAEATVPNLVIARVGVDGSVSLFNSSGSTHLIVDVAGWFPAIPTGLVSTDDQTSCFVRAGSVFCAGIDLAATGVFNPSLFVTGRAPQLIPGITNAISVSTGRIGSCAVLSDGTVKCWSYGVDPPSPVVIAISQVVQTATGEGATCALRTDGTVWCWGYDLFASFGIGTPGAKGPLQMPGLTDVSLLGGGAYRFCAANGSGVSCWGAFLSTGSAAVRSVTLEAAIGRVTSLAVDGDQSCASLPSGLVTCWGYGSFLGDGVAHGNGYIAPVVVFGIADAISVSSHSLKTCVVRATGLISCWGQGRYGGLGNTGFLYSAVPVPVQNVSDAVLVSVGKEHACAVLGDWSVSCWGSNAFGQVGNGQTGSTVLPKKIAGLLGATQLSLGSTSCALVSSTPLCWGEPVGGLLGAELPGSSDPKPIALAGVSKIAAGSPLGTVCGIVGNGGASCVGSNGYGSLGDGNISDSPTPVTPVGLTSGVSDISVSSHVCAVRNGGLWCWGENSFGKYGPSTSRSPIQVPGITNAVSVKVNGSNTCVLTNEGTVFCLGANFNNLLGTGGTGMASSSVPIQIAGITGARSLSVGPEKACVTTASGIVRCWGGGSYFSQLPGEVTTISGISNAVNVAVGQSHLCTLLNDRTVSCRGADPFNPQSLQPVPNLSEVVEIASTSASMCARTASLEVYCWGSNVGGQLGDGTGFYYEPQKVTF